jgi:very-short-patch-repair endonuclease
MSHRPPQGSDPVELTIWQLVRRDRLGVRFRRQEPIGPYIVDFVSLRRKIIIEADGSQHDWSDHDMRRDSYLRGPGFQVLRFENKDVARYPDWVADQIRTSISPPLGRKYRRAQPGGRGERTACVP